MSEGEDRIELLVGDITSRPVDAIVNAANSRLTHGAGVAGAIAAAAGPELQRASSELVAREGPVEVGDAAITPGFELAARYVIHAVGPVYGGAGGREAELLERAHRSAIALAAEHACRSIAFPAISTGVYGYPVGEAAPVALAATAAALGHHPAIERVEFCLFSEEVLAAFRRALG